MFGLPLIYFGWIYTSRQLINVPEPLEAGKSCIVNFISAWCHNQIPESKASI